MRQVADTAEAHPVRCNAAAVDLRKHHGRARPIPLDLEIITEARLVSEALGGSQAAFEQIVRRYQRPVISLIARMIGDRGVAEELAQETFVKAFRNLGGFDVTRRLSSWLFRIAHNTTLDWLRRVQPAVVALDALCRWRPPPRSRGAARGRRRRAGGARPGARAGDADAAARLTARRWRCVTTRTSRSTRSARCWACPRSPPAPTSTAPARSWRRRWPTGEPIGAGDAGGRLDRAPGNADAVGPLSQRACNETAPSPVSTGRGMDEPERSADQRWRRRPNRPGTTTTRRVVRNGVSSGGASGSAAAASSRRQRWRRSARRRPRRAARAPDARIGMPLAIAAAIVLVYTTRG